MVALRLAKAGYGGGDPERILDMRADVVIAALHYENFAAAYERAAVEIARRKPT